MPSFDIVKDIKPESSYRVSAIVSNFDLDLDHLEERFAGEINPPEGWQIGLIVGGERNGQNDDCKRVFPGGVFRRI